MGVGALRRQRQVEWALSPFVVVKHVLSTPLFVGRSSTEIATSDTQVRPAWVDRKVQIRVGAEPMKTNE